MESFRKGTLGRTGLKVGRLGVAASYGAPAEAFEEAFEKGCNYFYLGSGRHRAGMHQAIRSLCGRGHRDNLVVAVHTYARIGLLTQQALGRTLRSLGIERADVLVLGWHNRRPTQMLLDRARQLRDKGLVRFLGMSGHNRSLFPDMADSGQLDLLHIRYNAAHRGAETECFPQLAEKGRPGIVTYTATRWGHLLDPKKMPPDEAAPAPRDCYRFVMSNPSVDVCLSGPKDRAQMQEALKALELGPMGEDETARMKKIGDYIHSRGRGFF
jgi:predicted aldo/keto reductase-like oxidoreductase